VIVVTFNPRIDNVSVVAVRPAPIVIVLDAE
jgi:hypothetical protein